MYKKFGKLFYVFLLLFSLTACKKNNKNNDDDNDIPDNGIVDEGTNNEDNNDNNNEEVVVPSVDYCQKDANTCVNYAYTPSEEFASLTEAYRNTYKSVVTIQTFVDGDLVMASGSGVIYATSSDQKYVYILTNAHVIKDNMTMGGVMKVKYYEVLYHNNVRVSAELLAKDLAEDVAVLKAEIEPNKDYSLAKFGDESTLSVGDSVYTIGSPYDVEHNNTLTSGIVSRLDVSVDSDNDGDGTSTRFYLIQIDAALSSGNSGGPLFNLKGEVVGINTLKLEGQNSNVVLESMNFCLKIKSVINIMNSILKDGTYTRPYIGILALSISDISLVERETLGISKKVLNGIFVEGVFEDSPAANIILKNSIITKINGKAINSFASFSAELLNYKKGDSISLTVVDLNNENEATKQIILG